MNKIDLEAIAMKYIKARPHHTKFMIARAVAIEVAHQALVLASEKANIIKCWPKEDDSAVEIEGEIGENEAERGKMFTEDSNVTYWVDKQSILDVEKLIV